jgi:transcriptional regulator with XRE-family HTH domain
MDDIRLGTVVKQLRQRLRLTQEGLAGRARISPSMVSRIERGDIDRTTLVALRRVFTALGARIELVPRWQGADLDRLLDARHAAMVEVIVGRLSALPSWIVETEVTFSIYGERGSIDIVAWHPGKHALLIIEVKTAIGDVGGLLRQVDRYRRLARDVARQRGWSPRVVSVWVVVADGRTARRRLSEHHTTLRGAFPADGHAMEHWLRDPQQAVSGLSFLPIPRFVGSGRHDRDAA